MAQREELILDITARLDQALRDVAALQEQVEALTNAEAEVTIAAAVEGAEEIEELATTTEELDGTEAEVTIGAEDEATEVVGEVTTGVEELDGAEAAVSLAAEDEASEIVEEVTEGVDDLDGAEAEVELDADDNASDVVEDVQSAVDDLDGETAEVELQVEGGEEASETIEGLGAGLLALGPAALGGIAAAGLGKIAEASSQATLDIQALADATGTSLEVASGLAEQFDFVGVSAGKLQTMIGRVADTIAATPGLAERLNVDAALPPVELFIASVDALNNSQLSATDKIALGIDVFGRKGLQSVQAIGSQVGDLSTAIEDIPDWQVVTEEDTQSAIEFKQTMDEIGDQVAEVAQTFLTVLGPAIQDAFEKLESLGGAINSVASLGQEGTARSVYDYFKAQGDAIVALQDEYLALGGTIESLRDNYFHLAEVEALLDLGVPPEVIAQADLTANAVRKLIDTMADSAGTATAMGEAFTDGAVSMKEWQQITADGVITMAEVEAAINDTDIALATAAGGAEQFSEAVGVTTAELNNMLEKMPAAAGELGDFGATWQQVVNDLEDGGRLTDETTLAVNYLSKALDKAPEDILSTGQAMADANLTTAEMNEALTKLQDPLTILPDLWETLINDVADGSLDFENAKGAVDQLADATGLSAEKILAMADAEAKLREEKLADKLKEDAAAAKELGDTIADIRADLPDLGSELADALDTADATVDFQGAKASVDDAIEDLQTYIDENEGIDWSALLDTSKIAPGDIDAGMISVVQGVRDSLQEGIVAAFEIGGAPAAQHFLDTFVPQLMEAGGLSQSEVYTLLGIPEDGTIDAVLQPIIDEAAAARAVSILDAIVGAGVSDPRIAAIQIALEKGQIPGEIAEIAALLLAQEHNIPVNLEGIPPEDIAAAQAYLDGNPVTYRTETDTRVTQRLLDEVADPRTASYDSEAPNAPETSGELDDVAAPRTAPISASILAALIANAVLTHVARQRTASIVAEAHTGQAEYELNNTARTRHSTIVQHTVSTGGGGGGGGAQAGTNMAAPTVAPAGVATLTAAPAALSVAPAAVTAAPTVVVDRQPVAVTINAAVIGNRFEVQRAVTRALRQSERINGRRHVA